MKVKASRWAWHGPDGMNMVESRRNIPLLDAAVSALVENLNVCGLLNDVAIVVWREYPSLRAHSCRCRYAELFDDR
ncbi:MAG: hypothetical protein HYX68_26055 [Planctomycetes bacterium]|nr:hypothetical protein [Planctomycetota bacterium]